MSAIIIRAVTAQVVARENTQFDFDRSKALAVQPRTIYRRRDTLRTVVAAGCRVDDDDNTIYFWTGIRQSGAAKRQL